MPLPCKDIRLEGILIILYIKLIFIIFNIKIKKIQPKLTYLLIVSHIHYCLLWYSCDKLIVMT